MTKVKNEPQVAPHLRLEIKGQDNVNDIAAVRNGEQVLWVNAYSKNCTLRFTQSPFADGSLKHYVHTGEYFLSPAIQGPIGTSYRYKVDCNEEERPHEGDPVIVIQG